MRYPRPVQLLIVPTLLGVITLAGCAGTDDTTEQSAPVVAGDDTSQAAATPTESPTETADDFPEAVDVPEQGGTYGVVVLSDGTDAELTASQEAVAEYGFQAYTAEIGCLDGAGPVLGIPDGTIVSHLVFVDIDDAQDFTSLYSYLDGEAEVVGAAEAKTYCLDG